MAASSVADHIRPAASPGSGAVRQPAKAPLELSQRRREWVFDAPPGATREDPLHPVYWANVCRYLTRFDIIVLYAHDRSWELELSVETVKQSGAEVLVRKHYSHTPENLAGTPIGDDFRTEFRAGDGWCVIRLADRVPIIRGHTLEVSAINQFHREQPKAA